MSEEKAVVRVLPDGTMTRMEAVVRPLRRVVRVVSPFKPASSGLEISQRQEAQATAYRLIAKSAGQWDKGAGSEGSHYVQKHPFRDEGIVCANCVFYKGPRACELVEGEIDPMAICKLWVIPDKYVSPTNGGNESNA